MVRVIKITRVINLVEGRCLSRLSKQVRAAMVVAAVNIPDLSSVECKDAEILPGITGMTA
jgi:hypothetical protein